MAANGKNWNWSRYSKNRYCRQFLYAILWVKKHCELCNCDVTVGSWSGHLQTRKRLQNKELLPCYWVSSHSAQTSENINFYWYSLEASCNLMNITSLSAINLVTDFTVKIVSCALLYAINSTHSQWFLRSSGLFAPTIWVALTVAQVLVFSAPSTEVNTSTVKTSLSVHPTWLCSCTSNMFVVLEGINNWLPSVLWVNTLINLVPSCHILSTCWISNICKLLSYHI